jgi:hypothetical protein
MSTFVTTDADIVRMVARELHRYHPSVKTFEQLEREEGVVWRRVTLDEAALLGTFLILHKNKIPKKRYDIAVLKLKQLEQNKKA